MNTITITVTGPRASGKTTAAARLVALLRACGYQAQYVGRTRAAEDAINEMVRDGQVGGLALPLKFAVRDMD